MESSSCPKKFAERRQKRVSLNKCSSYPRSELPGDFYEEVLRDPRKQFDITNV